MSIGSLISKYRAALIITLAYYALVLFLLGYASSSVELQGFDPKNYLTPLIPFYNLWAQLIMIFLVFSPISALIGGLVGGYFLAPVFLLGHKNILGLKMIYGIQDRPKVSTFKKLTRGCFPALFAININFIILYSAPYLIDPIIHSARAGFMTGFIVLLMFTIGLGAMVFAPTWFLTDAGIVYSNKNKVVGTDQPVEERTVGGRFTDLLRGYAGIAVILSYIQFLSVYFNEQTIQVLAPMELIGTLAFFFGFPIYMIIATIPSLVILDIMKEHRIRFIRKIAEKMGISDFVEISFEKVKEK